ncbi:MULTISPECIES: MBL fold metallo-hydrolase [unclassified Rhodococcus (in: high G+C Gram-positive bacteria)]|uniref:MBL fold metallo-hydrolase n=1 Tax=unclassified Rhodococcus (in: high G+C Gram-positive bacteria) TaxID=192944 RepID=UPI00163B5EFE|nr:MULTISPECIES: MBL fold metallo-hydrolase [unclassified Rhodococcus (in: high G+C Gram-positive bacteria)]MBC2637910.1 MBL fold metallo-hydrolase [Rhodococcus sp. 3A]MBC2897342.1 MBL fold metallo-hydrolase [Rhodococcus sp. 4CII]
MPTLSYDVYVAPSIPTAIPDIPPDMDRRWWSPISSTLISGVSDAVLVDPLMTVAQARHLTDWVGASGKNLTTIYITHGHGDHWFGLATLLERFPRARAIATPAVVAHAQQQCAPEFVESFWKSRFPGQIPDRFVLPEPLMGDSFEIEGEEIRIVELGHTDTDDTTALHVPSIDLVVAGDAAYNDVHLYLAESSVEGRKAWIAALETLAALTPTAVVAGHKNPDRGDLPEIIEQTKRYIHDFEAMAASTSTTLELYHCLVDAYPHRVNPGAAWGSARSAKG